MCLWGKWKPRIQLTSPRYYFLRAFHSQFVVTVNFLYEWSRSPTCSPIDTSHVRAYLSEYFEITSCRTALTPARTEANKIPNKAPSSKEARVRLSILATNTIATATTNVIKKLFICSFIIMIKLLIMPTFFEEKWAVYIISLKSCLSFINVQNYLSSAGDFSMRSPLGLAPQFIHRYDCRTVVAEYCNPLLRT